MRRCNLACAYCNEYDARLAAGAARGDARAGSTSWPTLGTAMITISGGEPLMHPELDAMVARMRRRGMFASLITNGYLPLAGADRAPATRPASTTCRSASTTWSRTRSR